MTRAKTSASQNYQQNGISVLKFVFKTLPFFVYGNKIKILKVSIIG